MDSNTLRTRIGEQLIKASGGTLEVLKDDAKVREAVAVFYDVLPAPARVAIRLTMGEEGLHKLGLQVRDFMLSEQLKEVANLAKTAATESASALQLATQDIPRNFNEKYRSGQVETSATTLPALPRLTEPGQN